MPSEAELRTQLKTLGEELDRRTERAGMLRPYDEGGCPVPDAVTRGKMTRAYTSLMSASSAPWGSLIVDSVQDRLEVANFTDSQNEAAAEAAWEIWQDNAMDDESKLAHRSALVDGRANALVWVDPETGQPAISLDDCTQMVVQHREGSRRHRVAAMRRWAEGKQTHATLYRPEGIYKFQRRSAGALAQWERREVSGEVWPLANPLEKVPVVELGVNRRLKPGPYPYARGEFENCVGLMDRINLLTFFGLVVALWMGFPLRGVVGADILKDDEGKALPPFESRPDSVFQFTEENAKIVEFSAADRSNLSIFEEFEQLAALSKTPKHYFPMAGGISNIAEPTIRAFEGGLHAKVDGHHASLGEGHEEIVRLGCAMLPEPLKLSPRANTEWMDHESRSLSERADAFVKLTSNNAMPALMAAELALNLTADEKARWQSTQMGAVFDALLQESVDADTTSTTIEQSGTRVSQPRQGVTA